MKTYRVRTAVTTHNHIDNPSLDTIDVAVPQQICEQGLIGRFLKQKGKDLGFYPYSFWLLEEA